ncbi:hypothetical protein MIDIC_170051 [Alphaproteobacteria bacterium]
MIVIRIKVFDARDAKYADFYLWQDKNSDGISQPGELTSLQDAGIISIDLNKSQPIYGEMLEMGASYKAPVLWADGHTTYAYDLTFYIDGGC